MQRDQVHLATWITGELPTVDELVGLTGTATYSGHVITNVINGGNQYIAAGGFRNEWDFGAGSGTVNITNLDGRSYSGAVANASDIRHYSGTLAGPGSFSADVKGSFFGAQVDPATLEPIPPAATAGQVRIGNGADYNAAGTFAAEKQ